MDEKEKIRIRYLRFTSLYAIIVLIVIILFLRGNKKTNSGGHEYDETERAAVTSDEYVYVSPVDDSLSESITDTDTPVYTVKSYMGKIGIFTDDGKLWQVLEVYVKTLPEADIRLLEEGFEVVGQSQLNSIIEDYTE